MGIKAVWRSGAPDLHVERKANSSLQQQMAYSLCPQLHGLKESVNAPTFCTVEVISDKMFENKCFLCRFL